MTIVYSQNFESTPVGALPSGWTEITGTWIVTASNPVSGSNALTGGAADGNKIVCTAAAALADMEVRYDVNYQAYFVGIYLRTDSTLQNGYVAIPDTVSLGVFDVYKFVSGSATHLGTIASSGLPSAGPGQKYSLRARMQGSVFYLKIWQFGTAEPTSWSGTITDSSVTAAGYFGFYNNSSGSGNATIDNVTLDNLIVGALTAGTSSSSGITANSATVTNSGASGGTSPYTYQWYRSTTSGFTPNSGNLVSGATSLTLNDTGLSASTTYYYVLVATDSVSAAADSTQLAITTSALAALVNGSLSHTSVGSTTATVVDSGASGGTSPYTYRWYRSTVSGFTPSSSNLIVGANGATLNDTSLNPSTSYYYVNVVTDSASSTAESSQLTVTTSAGSTTVAVTNAALFWSPGNWDHLTAGTFSVATDTMQTTAPGAYLKFAVTGTVNLALSIDTSPMGSFPSGDFPIIRTSIDNAPFTDAQFTVGQTTLTLSTGLSPSATHSVEVFYRMAMLTEGDAWGSSGISPTNVVRIQGIVIDSGGSVPTLTLRSKRMLIFSDSIGEGEHVFTDGTNDSTQAFPAIVAQALAAEYGQICYGGHGWGQTSSGNVPGLTTSYQYLSVGRLRSFSSLDYILIVEGGNDARAGAAGSSIQSDCQAVLTALRTVCGSATKIIIAVECMGSYSSDLSAAVTAYKASSGDAHVYFTDVSALFTSGVFTLTFGSTTQWTYDGVHPLVYGQARYAAALAQGITAAIVTASGTSPNPSGYSRARLCNE
jgi:lysophospholipase L1-like esterase